MNGKLSLAEPAFPSEQNVTNYRNQVVPLNHVPTDHAVGTCCGYVFTLRYPVDADIQEAADEDAKEKQWDECHNMIIYLNASPKLFFGALLLLALVIPVHWNVFVS